MTSPEDRSTDAIVPGRWRNVDPMFDGHLEKPLLSMTVDERIDWIWQGMQLTYWLRDAQRQAPGRMDSSRTDNRP
jgi:hypothetical protein